MYSHVSPNPYLAYTNGTFAFLADSPSKCVSPTYIGLFNLFLFIINLMFSALGKLVLPGHSKSVKYLCNLEKSKNDSIYPSWQLLTINNLYFLDSYFNVCSTLS